MVCSLLGLIQFFGLHYFTLENKKTLTMSGVSSFLACALFLIARVFLLFRPLNSCLPDHIEKEEPTVRMITWAT